MADGIKNPALVIQAEFYVYIDYIPEQYIYFVLSM